MIPLVSYPILLASQQGFRDLSVGLVGGHAARGGAAVRGAGDPARLREPVRDPAPAQERRDRRQHGRPRLRAVHRRQHPRHVPAGVLVHPDLRHAADARGFRPGAGADLDRRPVAAAQALRAVRGRGDPRVDLPAVGHQAARGRHAPLREGVRLQLHPGRAGGDDDRADPQRGPGDPLRSTTRPTTSRTATGTTCCSPTPSARRRARAPIPRSVAILGLAGGTTAPAVPPRLRQPDRHHRGRDRSRDPRHRPSLLPPRRRRRARGRRGRALLARHAGRRSTT